MANNPNQQHQPIPSPSPKPDAIDVPVLEDLGAPANGRTAVQKAYYAIGRIYGRTVNPFVDFVNVLLTGNQLAHINALFEIPEDEGPDGPDIAHPPCDPIKARQAISWLVHLKPSVIYELERPVQTEAQADNKTFRLTGIGSWVSDAMREARCDDSKHLKKGLLNNFGLPADHDSLGNFTFPLADKIQLGYHNDRTARLLVPMTKSWDNEEDRNLLKQEGGIRFHGRERFKYLWLRCHINPNNYREGFMLGEWLVRCYGRLFFSYSKGNKQNSTSKTTVARKANMQEATLPSVVYTAVLARFVISDEAQWGDNFPNQAYYTSLMEQLEEPSERATKQSILEYYNRDLTDDPALASPIPNRDEETLQALDVDWEAIAARPLRTRECTYTPTDPDLAFPGVSRKQQPPVAAEGGGKVGEEEEDDSDKENNVVGRESLEAASVRGKGKKVTGAGRKGKGKGKGKAKEAETETATVLAAAKRGKKRGAEVPVASGSGRKLRRTTLGESSFSNARK